MEDACRRGGSKRVRGKERGQGKSASKGKRSRRKGKARVRQHTIFDGQWGGAREGSGPKPKPGAGVPHDRREQFSRTAVHVTLKVGPDLNGLRHEAEAGRIRRVFELCKQGIGFRLVHYSIQWDHMHLVVEAEDARALSAAMKGLTIRLARTLNALWKRKGQVFPDRYHATVITSVRHLRNVVRYVLLNGRKHGSHTVPGPDPLSSGPAYQGWSDRALEHAEEDPCIVLGSIWLFTIGLAQRGAPFATHEVPPHATSSSTFATERKSERRRRRAS
jgi:putative transposase